MKCLPNIEVTMAPEHEESICWNGVMPALGCLGPSPSAILQDQLANNIVIAVSLPLYLLLHSGHAHDVHSVTWD